MKGPETGRDILRLTRRCSIKSRRFSSCDVFSTLEKKLIDLIVHNLVNENKLQVNFEIFAFIFISNIKIFNKLWLYN
jgi:hypothetical protein